MTHSHTRTFLNREQLWIQGAAVMPPVPSLGPPMGMVGQGQGWVWTNGTAEWHENVL